MRGVAHHLGISRLTVERKFQWLSEVRFNIKPHVEELQFDELETIEHTKCKPLSILVCVAGDGTPLALKVSRMPAKGRLAQISRKKYGLRADERRQNIFQTLRDLPIDPLLIKTDANPSYTSLIKKIWPKAIHQIHNRAEKERHQSRLHESKTFDPMFQVNHLCARLRADIRRLTRRSWCTTKRPEYLQKHLNLYLNQRLLHS